mgnify:CR=1 FL=1
MRGSSLLSGGVTQNEHVKAEESDKPDDESQDFPPSPASAPPAVATASDGNGNHPYDKPRKNDRRPSDKGSIPLSLTVRKVPIT